MPKILVKDELDEMVEGTRVSGLVLIQNYGLQPQKNGGYYVAGYLQAKGQMPFKVWSSSSKYGDAYVKLCQEGEYVNTICKVDGKIDKFSGTSLVIESLSMYDGDVNGIAESDFLQDTYDVSNWWTKLEGVLEKNVSSKAFDLFKNLMSSIKSDFMVEFGAISHHDNCKGGLLAHTTKVVRIASLIKMYPEILKRVDSDLLYLGCALHDIGKVWEYHNGGISNEGKVLSHHTFGVMFLVNHRDVILDTMGEAFYLNLLAIVEQHHGEYEERPRTVASYVIHKLDMLDSDFTSLDSALKDSKNNQISFSGFKLN